MSIVKANAIILHSKKQGETSKIVTLYTREFGRLTVMAKGSRGIKSKYLGVLETFNYVDVVFYKKEGRGMQYLSQASIIEPLQSIHARLGKMALASIPCEVIHRGEEENHSHPKLFTLLLDTLVAIDKNDKNLRNIVRTFMMRYLTFSGFEPTLGACHSCGRENLGDTSYFSLLNGAYNCDKCGPLEDSINLSSQAMTYLRWFMKANVADATAIATSATVGKECDNFLYSYFRSQIESLSTLRSIEHLQNLQAELSGKM